MATEGDRGLLRDNEQLLAEMKAVCSGDRRPGPAAVLALLSRASVALAATSDRLSQCASSDKSDKHGCKAQNDCL